MHVSSSPSLPLSLSPRHPVSYNTSMTSKSTQRVKDALENLGIPVVVQELPASTRTAKEAAAAADCEVGQIVKSLVFQMVGSKQPVLILTSGANQVDENLAKEAIGEGIKFASADFVREQTGFAIGGVSPYGLTKKIPIYIDRDLLQYEVIWAAAGSHNAIFSIEPNILVETTGAVPIQVA